MDGDNKLPILGWLSDALQLLTHYILFSAFSMQFSTLHKTEYKTNANNLGIKMLYFMHLVDTLTRVNKDLVQQKQLENQQHK